jgi:hypothetical protein
MDQSKKTMRHFYCRDVLWETFEQMANDFDCSIDYLVNEAMRYYARSKNYQSPGGGGGGGNAPNPTGAAPAAQPHNNSGASPAFGSAQQSGATAPKSRQPLTQPPPSPASSAPPPRRPAPPTPGYAAAGAQRGATAAVPHMAAQQPHMQAQHAPAPAPMTPPAAAPPAAGPGGASPTLFLVYNGQRYPVTKDQFIIGRGSKTSDLPIKDGNISRKHAAVIRRNGTFYIKDLGSTNGIDYKGMRIDNKRIDEGDIFHLCDYELRFTYRTD